jgi:hypothetical protein
MIHFCNRGRENLRDLQTSDFQVKTDAQGVKYILMKDKLTKNHREGDENESQGGRMYATSGNELCPVDSFLKYLSALNSEAPFFWQRPKSKVQAEDTTWFEKSPVGKNTLGNKMKNLSKMAELSKIHTNHCLRATCITQLDHMGFASRQIMAVSGHRSETSLKHYSKLILLRKKE